MKDAHRGALTGIVENGPTPATHGVVRWRMVDLCQWMWEKFHLVIAERR